MRTSTSGPCCRGTDRRLQPFDRRVAVVLPRTTPRRAPLRGSGPGAGPFPDGRPPRGASSSSFRPIRRRPRIDAPAAAGPGTGSGCSSFRPVRSGDRRSARRSPPGQVPSGQRSGDDGGRPSRTPEGPVVRLGDGSGRAGPTAPRRSLPPWRVRALRGAVGGGSRRDAYCGEVGRRQEEHRRRGARWCACRGRRARDPSRRSRSPGEGGVTGHGVLEAVRRTASSGWVPWSRCGQPGGRGARQGGGRGEPRVRQGDGSPRARASPVAVGKDRAGLWEDRGGRCGQPVG